MAVACLMSRASYEFLLLVSISGAHDTFSDMFPPVPIKKVAGPDDLNLDIHQIDTFTGWAPPKPIDLIIAVSFGLLVPPRILNGAKYGGLNVHPSLLPESVTGAPRFIALLLSCKQY